MKHGFNPWYSRGLYCSLSFFHVRSVFPQVMPILKLLYNPDNHNAHHIYMSLIILLILSQDENFNKSVHELVWIKWYILVTYHSPHIRESRTVLDSGFHAVNSGSQVLDSKFFVSGTWIPNSIVGGIPDFLWCIPRSNVQDSRFHEQKFPGSWDTDSSGRDLPQKITSAVRLSYNWFGKTDLAWKLAENISSFQVLSSLAIYVYIQ